MEKNYNHLATEDALYALWEASGLMRADNQSDKKPFTIPLPPPNVTGQLHLGHAAMLAIEDILIRYKKMTGHETLWVPGTDHAAIATESVVLRHHNMQSREENTREEFLTKCRAFAQEKHDTIVNQTKKMGAWLDWSREAYTFDEARNHAVNHIFKELYEDGLIVRGHRMVNWSVGAQSVLSDDEIEWEDQDTTFYEFWCGPFIIGTVRTETKCADSPVVVHPTAKYIIAENKNGQELIVTQKYWSEHQELFEGFEVQKTVQGQDLTDRKFTAETYAGTREFYVLADETIDPEFGTGAMTISTSHDPHDFELAQKYDLPFTQKIDFNGKMTAIAGPCEGLPVIEARREAAKLMEQKGLLLHKTPHTNRVPLCYRSGTVVEPMISPQWFIAVEKEYTDRHTGKKTTLKKILQDAVREGHVQIIPKRFEKIYFQWIDNLRDWCISRQIWWGHRIPVWYDEQDNIHLPQEQKLLFARHGQSEANLQGVLTWADRPNPLTEKGIEQAHETGKNLKGRNIKRIIASPTERAKNTAKIIAQELGINPAEITYWDELQEITYDEIAGTPIPKDGVLMKMQRENVGEDFGALNLRAERFWTKIKELEASDDEILIVGHTTMTSIIWAVKKGLQPHQFAEHRRTWHLGNAEVRQATTLCRPAGKNLRQDEDTLDTWFSSALWPFSTLGWPEEGAADFEKFYPTDVLETGHDIIFFWVARMIMFGRYATGKYPFHTTYLHGLVTDEHGKKMSKSKGNGIDPLDVIAKYGADAVRLSLVIGTSPGNPIPLGDSKISGYRNFVNKLWNAGRFVAMQEGEENSPEAQTLADRWILSRLDRTVIRVSEHLDKYEISAAGDALYHFVWDEFCDWYLEAQKAEKSPAFLRHIFEEILKLCHPLCPFVTEQLARDIYGQDTALVTETFPQIDFYDEEAIKDFEWVQECVTALRQIRADHAVAPKDKIKVALKTQDTLGDKEALIKTLARVEEIAYSETPEGIKFICGKCEGVCILPFDEEKAAAAKQQQIAELQKSITALKARLDNPSYADKAPPALVQQTRDQLAEAEAKLRLLEK